MYILALVYLLALSAILAAGVKSPQLGWLRAALAVFLLVWAVLILTAQLLSLFSVLNVTWLFVAVSVIIALGASAALRNLRPTHKFSFPEFKSPFGPRATIGVTAFLAVSAVLVLVGDLMLARAFLPSNGDSIVYRFPRVYWYFSQGSFAHFTNDGDERPLFYPLNGVIAYLPLVHFQLGPRSFSLMSLTCWLMAGLSTYVFARDYGGPRVVAAATAWTILLTPNVLLQSLSTNDELIAAAPLLAGLFFLHRWYHARQPFDALLGVIGLAISAGTKLHVSYYILLLAAVAVALAWHYRALWAEVRGWRSVRAAGFIGLLVSIGVVFAFSFLIYNYRGSGQLMPWDLVAQVQNKPFDVYVALQNAVLQTARMVLTPVADLHLGSSMDWTARKPHYLAFNAVFAPLFTWVNNSPAFTSAGYSFTGINPVDAVLFNEYTLYIGFTWLVWFIAAVWLFSRWRDPQLLWARFHAASFPVWILTYAANSRFIEGFAVYLGYATVVMAPAMVFAFAPIKSVRLAQIRMAVLAAIAATQVFFAASILYTNPAKNLGILQQIPARPLSWGFSLDQTVKDELDLAKSGITHHWTVWGQPYWAFMAFHPEIRHFRAARPQSIRDVHGEDDAQSKEMIFSRYFLTPHPASATLHLYAFPQIPVYGQAVPIRIPDLASPGLTWIGNLLFAYGPEWVFAAGNGVETRFPGRRGDYIIVPYEVGNSGPNGEPLVRIVSRIYGLNSNDDLKFKFEVRIDGRLVSGTDWLALPAARLPAPDLKPGNGTLTVSVRNDSAGGTVHSAEVALQSNKPLELDAQ